MQITLANLGQATEQQVFDQVKNHLFQQNERSGNENGCYYRLEKNGKTLKCAAGCLMTDEEINEKNIRLKSSWNSLVAEDKVPPAHKKLISRLQSIHDNYLPNEWEDTLREFAKSFGLIYKN